jgi:hypothetical protein
MFVVAAEKLEETSLGIETVAQQDVEGTGMLFQDSLDQSQGGRALIFAGALKFKVQQEEERWAGQHENNGPVIVLDPFLAVHLDDALLALATTPDVTAVYLMAIYHRQAVSANGSEHLVANHAMIHVAQNAAQTGNIEDFCDIGELIAGRHWVAKKTPETGLGTELVEGVEAWEAREPENQECLWEDMCRDFGLLPVVFQAFEQVHQTEYLLAISQHPG